jgi:DNA polymerase I-like protein with 3'-5' exonuclease and polymerase domains
MLKVSDTKEYYLVENAADIEEMSGVLDDVDLVAFDTETTGLNVRKDKVIGYSFSYQEGQGFYVPFYTYEERVGEVASSTKISNLKPVKIPGALELLKKIATKKLVMHNASFDTRVVINNLKVDTLSNLHADTMLMEHTLNEEGPFGLKEMALLRPKEIGMSQEDVANQEQVELEENVKSKGGSWKKSNKEIYKADLNVLAKYAIADTDLTIRFYNTLSKKLKKENLEQFFYSDEVMPLYKKVIILMEQYGVHLDMPKLKKLMEECKNDIQKLEELITKLILESVEGQQFVQLRLTEEVEIKPSGNFAQAVATYYDLPLPKNANGKYSLAAKKLESLEPSAAKDFLLGINSTIPEKNKIALEILKQEGPLININSKQQLSKLVFDVMQIKPLSTTDKGAPQFNEAMVEYLSENNIVPWAKDLHVYNKLVKIYGSSYERFMEEQEDGVFYPYYKQHGTTSGRLSSNIQQLPRPVEAGEEHPLIEKYTNEIRSLFIPPSGYVFIDDDYASLEPSVFAHDSSDQPLLDIFIKGEDFYSKVAIMALGLENASADKKSPNFLKKINPKARQDAKGYSLGIRYGAEEGKVSQLLGIEKEEAKVIVDSYFKAFPKLKAKMDTYKTQAKTLGKVTSEFGRVRHLPEAREIYEYFGDDILDYTKMRDLMKKSRMSFNELSDIRKRYKNLLNNALNFPIQSAANTIISRAAVKIMETFETEGIDGWITAAIHDELIVCVNELQKERAQEIVQGCMENTTKLKVPLFAEPNLAYNFRDGK